MATETELKAWLATYPRNWNGLCQALLWQVANKFGSAVTVYGSARIAYRASTIRSLIARDAPAGAAHYWAIGTYDHVALGLDGERVLMGSSHVATSWGTNVGVTTVAAYTRATGAKYLGWSYMNGLNSTPVEIPIAAAGISDTSNWTSTEEDGLPGTVYWLKVQSEIKERYAYSGGIDGKPATVTHHLHIRLQAAILNAFAHANNLPRTSTEEDGRPGKRFWLLAQTMGKSFGYTGEVDGDPGTGTTRALARLTAAWLNRHGR